MIRAKSPAILPLGFWLTFGLVGSTNGVDVHSPRKKASRLGAPGSGPCTSAGLIPASARALIDQSAPNPSRAPVVMFCWPLIQLVADWIESETSSWVAAAALAGASPSTAKTAAKRKARG